MLNERNLVRTCQRLILRYYLLQPQFNLTLQFGTTMVLLMRIWLGLKLIAL